MRAIDVIQSIVFGVALLVVVLIGPLGIASIVGPIADTALRYWWVGVALTAAAIVLRWRRLVPGAGRVIGVIGVIWLTFVLGLFGLYLVVFFIHGPILQ